MDSEAYGEMWDEMPTSGTCFYSTSQDWRKEHVITGTYKKDLKNDWLTYRDGWGEICTPAQLYENSIMLAKLEVHDDCIHLEVTKVVAYYWKLYGGEEAPRGRGSHPRRDLMAQGRGADAGFLENLFCLRPDVANFSLAVFGGFCSALLW